MPRNELQRLADSLAATDPGDRVGLATLQRRLSAMRDRMSLAGSLDVAECLETAALMLEGALGCDGSEMQPFLESIGRMLEICPIEVGAPDEAGELAPESISKLMNDMLLGELLVHLGSVNESDMHTVLAEQREAGGKLGNALVEAGVVTSDVVENALCLQRSLRASAVQGPRTADSPSEQEPADVDAGLVADTQLGQVLLRRGVITREQLLEGLYVMRAAGLRIGEALQRIGAASWEEVASAVRHQDGADDSKRTQRFLRRWVD
jgi:hypothetical protein